MVLVVLRVLSSKSHDGYERITGTQAIRTALIMQRVHKILISRKLKLTQKLEVALLAMLVVLVCTLLILSRFIGLLGEVPQ